MPLFYKKFINKNCKVIAHYHEYTSVKEYRTGSFFVKMLWQLEKKNFYLLNIVSHTNKKRMSLFQEDYPAISFHKKLILPNYPPFIWSQYTRPKKKRKLKLVYVGAVSLETMYIKSIFEWIQKQKGHVSLDIYTVNIKANAKAYIENFKGKEINLKSGVSYQLLPKILINYDIGLILYKGHIPNYVYNAPNKLFEYLACGLDVWFPTKLLGSYEFLSEKESPLVSKVNFENLDSINNALRKRSEAHLKKLPLKKSEFFCEQVYQDLLTELLD